MTHCFRPPSPGLAAVAALLAGTVAAGTSHAYEPEIGKSIDQFPIVHAGGAPFDWSPGGASFRILIVGASWCPPCQALKTSLPNELARLRQSGINVSTVFVVADDFGPSGSAAMKRAGGPNRLGYDEAAPDPKRIDLSRESPKGVREWGAFRAYGYPITVLLDSRNVVVARYRGATSSHGVVDDVIALATKTGAAAGAPIAQPAATAAPRQEAAPTPRPKAAARDRSEDQAGDELIGLWKINNPEGKDPTPLFLRVIGVNATPAGPLELEASLSHQLSKWRPLAARCEPAATGCTLRLTTHQGGELTAQRQADGSYAGTIVITARSRTLVRPITMEPMSLDEAAL